MVHVGMCVDACRCTAAGLAAVISAMAVALPPGAEAVLNSPNAQIARNADAALRRAIPSFNPEVGQQLCNSKHSPSLLHAPLTTRLIHES